MAIHCVKGDILLTNGLTMIAHGVNLRGYFGAGIAGQIADRLPWARLDYRRWLAGPTEPKLGDIRLSVNPLAKSFTTSGTVVGSHFQNFPHVAHLATQLNPGADARIDAVRSALLKLRGEAVPEAVIAIPQIGCGIGGLEWSDVKPIIEETFKESRATIVIFEYFEAGVPGRWS